MSPSRRGSGRTGAPRVGSRGRIDWRKTAELRSVSAEWINAAYVNSNLYKVLVQGTTPGDGSGGAIELNTCHVGIRGLIALNSDNIITVRSNSEITVTETGADATYSTISGYAFWIGGIARVEVDDDVAEPTRQSTIARSRTNWSIVRS